MASYVAQNPGNYIFVLEGPAQKIFYDKFCSITHVPLREALCRCDRVITGSSWQSDLEWKAIAIGQRMGKNIITFLDHWVNYRERFIRNGEEHLPDELWVGDEYAEAMALRLFHDLSVRLIDNPYFADLRQKLTSLPRSPRKIEPGLNVLYVCEPVREHALREYGNERHWGYTEEDALSYFLCNIEALGKTVGRIVIRPHPSESADKYDWALAEFELPMQRGGVKPLFEEIAESDVVVGCESMAMVIGLLADRLVISSVPPGGKPCSLPHSAVGILTSMVRVG